MTSDHLASENMTSEPMTDEQLQLIQSVQHNCHISDAKHAGDYTLCVYLLKMREYYRWEKQQSFNVELSTDDIGDWLTQREGHWDEIDNQDYTPLEINGQQFDPFDSNSINSHLTEQGLVYSGGIGHKAKPHFFIGKLERHEKLNGYDILISAKEYARDLTSPPAMSRDNMIFIRRESFRRLIWERTEEWRWNKPENAMARAMRCYHFDDNPEDALNQMTDNELESTVLHEIGEIKASDLLPGWSDMMADVTFTLAEIIGRAVRDHLADSISTLPKLLEDNNEASIHFYFSNLTAMRKLIFPTLVSAYDTWINNHDISALHDAVENSAEHWKKVAQTLLSLHEQHKKACSTYIIDYIESQHL